LFDLISLKEKAKMNLELLIEKARIAREKSYSPYSKFRVGAALLTANGKIYLGCNIENAAFSPTICAEQTALVKAVSEGETAFIAIAVCGGTDTDLQYCPPCGVCRQVLVEFCHPETFHIIVAKTTKDYKIYTLGELLPVHFGPQVLEIPAQGHDSTDRK
jgi:cytidine deaminase